MNTMSSPSYPLVWNEVASRRVTASPCPSEDDKLRTSQLFAVAAEVGSALAFCGLLHWVAS